MIEPFVNNAVTPPSPSVKLQLFCERKRPEYYWCSIYRNEREFTMAMEYYGGLPKVTKGDDVGAACFSYVVKSGKKKIPELGTLFFYAANLHPSIVAHECVHAAANFARKRKFVPTEIDTSRYMGSEERFATCIGYMMEQFYQQQPGRAFCVRGLECSAA